MFQRLLSRTTAGKPLSQPTAASTRGLGAALPGAHPPRAGPGALSGATSQDPGGPRPLPTPHSPAWRGAAPAPSLQQPSRRA